MYFHIPIWFNHPNGIWYSPKVKNEWSYSSTPNRSLNSVDMANFMTVSLMVFSIYTYSLFKSHHQTRCSQHFVRDIISLSVQSLRKCLLVAWNEVYVPTEYVCAHRVCVCPQSMRVPTENALAHRECACPLSMRVPTEFVLAHWVCACPLSMHVPTEHARAHWACACPMSVCVPTERVRAHRVLSWSLKFVMFKCASWFALFLCCT